MEGPADAAAAAAAAAAEAADAVVPQPLQARRPADGAAEVRAGTLHRPGAQVGAAAVGLPVQPPGDHFE